MNKILIIFEVLIVFVMPQKIKNKSLGTVASSLHGGNDKPSVAGALCFMNESEQWKDILDYEGCYQVSNLGRIKALGRSVKRGNHFMAMSGRIMAQQLNNKGRRVIRLNKNGSGCNKNVARLVATAFVPNPENKPEVNHLDGDRLNNRATNLGWSTERENYDHAQKNGLMARGERQSYAKLKKEQVLEIFNSKERVVLLAEKV